MKWIVIGMFFLGSSFSVVAGDVDAFLAAYSSMDKTGYQVLSDYRSHIQSKCARDVTVEELKVFSKTPVYMKLLALRTMNSDATPEYKTTLATVSCKQ